MSFFWDCLLLSRSFSIGQTATSEKNKKQNTVRPPQDPTSYLHVGAAVVINLDSCGHRWSLMAQVYQRSSAGGQMGRRRSACLARTRDMMRETAWPTDVPGGWGVARGSCSINGCSGDGGDEPLLATVSTDGGSGVGRCGWGIVARDRRWDDF